jgi:hypothetical protein
LLRWYAAVLAVLGPLLAALPRATLPVTATLAVAGGGAETAARRAGAPAVPVAYGALAVAAAAHLAGRTGSPLCRPDSGWQWHAAWHVLSALALADWGRRRLR